MRSLALRSVLLIALLPLAACGTPAEDADYSRGAGMTHLGNVMREKGDPAAAMDFYRRALAKNPKHMGAIKGLAAAQEQWGDKQEAVKTYRQGIAVDGDDGELRRNLGRLLLSMDEPAAARKQYEAALDADSDDLKARSGLGVALDHLGEHKKAQEQYRKVLKNDPKNLATLNNLAYSYILTKRYDLAIKTLEPVTNHPKATPALRQNLALAYGMAGMDVDAERVARMDLSPEKVAENMDYFRRTRAEMAVSTAPYAEIGTYATEGMAVARAQELREQFEGKGTDLKPVVLPQVAAPGGTPRFAVRMMGCSRPDDISKLCKTLSAAGLPCVARGKGVE